MINPNTMVWVGHSTDLNPNLHPNDITNPNFDLNPSLNPDPDPNPKLNSNPNLDPIPTSSPTRTPSPTPLALLHLGKAPHIVPHDLGVRAFKFLDDLKALVELGEDVHHRAGKQGML